MVCPPAAIIPGTIVRTEFNFFKSPQTIWKLLTQPIHLIKVFSRTIVEMFVSLQDKYLSDGLIPHMYEV